MGTTTIPLSDETKQRLSNHGKHQETWDELVNRLLDERLEHGFEHVGSTGEP
jgi:predicted DNA-binding protein